MPRKERSLLDLGYLYVRRAAVTSRRELDVLAIEVDSKGNRKYAMVTMSRRDVETLVETMGEWLEASPAPRLKSPPPEERLA